MEYTGEGIEALVSVMNDIEISSLILVDKKLRSLLRCLAYYDEFRTVLHYCGRGFDYQAEKRKALQNVGDRKILRLPKNTKTLVALVSNMLVEFDEGSMDFLTFAGEYFPAATKQESFSACFVAFMEPFKLGIVSLIVEGAKEETPLVERNIEFASDGLQAQTEYLLVALVKAANEAQISPELRSDLLVMLEGFSAALDSRDTLMIRAVWLGIKKTLAANRLAEKEIPKVDEVLRLYLVVK